MTAILPACDRPTKEITITRVFDAPRELVYAAWTQAEHLERWWGPRVFTNHDCTVDLRPGGRFDIVMRSPDGVDYPMSGTYREVVPPEKLVFFSTADAPDGTHYLESLATVTFEAEDGKTKLTVNAKATGFVEIAAQMLAGMEAGWTQSLDKLGEMMAA